ncbi:hypothetical protein HYH02_001476 [Chlamydomonas schloesseri]|uniref:BACK domain-containing protein n=1 Tax=Chlamydomonas schloesseri TaxID=2026947 RepID=A0A835WW09_9CHLO|nr:hypothetical protein HYH02_001476 [Chlamydomonas schloesseri]|eukprot:KAG2454457.1 hypothetical protein HYH02_001476 [Chlamydomonas schloesseri]
MAASVLGALQKLYNSEHLADCRIAISLLGQPETVLRALPAHLFVVQAGSELFRAQAERWSKQARQTAGAGTAERPTAAKRKREETPDAACGDAALSLAPVNDAISSGDEARAATTPSRATLTPPPPCLLPQLCVALDNAADLRYALAAICFLYSGNLNHITSPSASSGVGHDGVGGAAGSSSGGSLAAALLHTRRLALYLQMPDCVAACEQALVERVARPQGSQAEAAAPATSAVSSSAVKRAGAAVRPLRMSEPVLAAVADLYAARKLLLPPPTLLPPESELPPAASAAYVVGADPGATALSYRLHMVSLQQLATWAQENELAVAAENRARERRLLMHRQGTPPRQQAPLSDIPPPAQMPPPNSAVPPPPTARQQQEAAGQAGARGLLAAAPPPPTFGELLAWAVCSAPHVLTNPEAHWHVSRLPMAAIQALLAADTFCTDDESSVLLLLAEWAQANPHVSPAELRRAQSLLRLSHMNDAYLCALLPHLASSWLPLSPHEVGLLAQCANGSARRRQRIWVEAQDLPSVRQGARWFASTPRPLPPVRVVDWSIPLEELPAGVAGSQQTTTFATAATTLVAKGFRWSVGVWRPGGCSTAAGVQLTCDMPQVLLAISSGAAAAAGPLASPGYLRLLVYGSDGRTVFLWEANDVDNDMIASNGGSWDCADALLLHEPAEREELQQEQQAWERHLIDGRLRGQLRWLPKLPRAACKAGAGE